jgi:hypothetical protein
MTTRDSALRLIASALACLWLAGCGWHGLDADHPRLDAVTRWTMLADRYGAGAANWRTLAIMHMAMHDALNAARPAYERWSPGAPDEPTAQGANPEVAMAAAAREVLTRLHPDRAADSAAEFEKVLADVTEDASVRAGVALGSAIGRAAVERRAHDGVEHVREFQGSEAPGRWRPAPTRFATSRTNDIRPFLFDDPRAVPTMPPPLLDSPAYQDELEEVRRVGGLHSAQRTSDQTSDAYFWAYQSSQRGFVDLAVRLFAAQPPRAGVSAEARVLAQLTAALADSAILAWNEKERYSFWRPITAIRVRGVDRDWSPLVETPPFPEYPSGHATDCFVGAGVLEDAFRDLSGPIVYISSAYMEPASGSDPTVAAVSMGQHAQWGDAEAPGGRERAFPSLEAAASDCSNSRVWAGAHFAAAEIEAKRLASVIVQRALGAAPPVGGSPRGSSQPAG